MVTKKHSTRKHGEKQTKRRYCNLAKQRARLQIKIPALLHQAMPGYADLREDDKLFNKSIAMPIALHFSSAEAIQKAKQARIKDCLRKKTRCQECTRDRIDAWSQQAAEGDPLQSLLTEQWKQLAQLHDFIDRSEYPSWYQSDEGSIASALPRTATVACEPPVFWLPRTW